MNRRGATGRFLSTQPRDSHFLLEIVREVARRAVAEDLRRTPLSVTHREFKEAAKSPDLVERYGHIPTPNAFCAQFPTRQGTPIRWHDLLQLALDDERTDQSRRNAHEALVKVDADLNLSDDHVFFALNYVVRAERAAGRTIRFLQAALYEEIRARLLASDNRRKVSHDLARRLPTRDQIERVAGGWWAAVELAGLELPPWTTPAGRRGLPLVEGVLRFYVASNGYLPSYGQMLDFAAAFRFSLQRFVGSWHEDVLEPARAEIERRKLGTPEPYEPRLNPKVEPPEGYEPDADDPIYQEKQYWDNKPLVLRFVIDYLDWLGRHPSSEHGWSRFRAEKAAWGIPLPSGDTLRSRYGGLRMLVREASLPGALERAIAEYEREPTAEELAEREARQIARDAATPQARQLLEFIAEQGEIGPKQIAERLDWSRTKVVIWCTALRKAGLISATHENPNHKKVRYFLVEGQSEEELRAIRAAREVELRARREATPPLLALLNERGPLPPQTIAAELGWSRFRLTDVLEDAIAARFVAATHEGKTRSVHYFAIEPNVSDEELERLRTQVAERVEWDTPQGRKLLALLREHKALMPKEIRELLGWDSAKVEYWLPRLVKHRFVARTQLNPKSRYGRYFAIAPGITDEQLQALRDYYDRQLPQEADDARRLHAWLLERGGEVAPKEIREAFDWYGSKVTDQLKLLQRAGMAEKVGEGGTHQSRWQGKVSEPPPGGWED